MENGSVLIINTYNDNTNVESMRKVVQYTRRVEQEGREGRVRPHILWLGDFNSHHPMWDEARNSHLFMRASLDRAQDTIEVAADHDLQMILPKGAPTLQAMATGNLTRMDNIFVSSCLAGTVTECRTVPEERLARTDHFP